jgi:hypothetical protein
MICDCRAVVNDPEKKRENVVGDRISPDERSIENIEARRPWPIPHATFLAFFDAGFGFEQKGRLLGCSKEPLLGRTLFGRARPPDQGVIEIEDAIKNVVSSIVQV